MDFRKVYDIVWCEALFKKLLGYGVSTNFVSFFEKFLWKTKLGVHLPRGATEFFPQMQDWQQESHCLIFS